ncbi:50S ribosomal protein L19 [Patescibacteria group bacterium]|nr:50S ribosomal protein L19 [Patescibacteria group bacterium]MBU1015837.1 50S ribosomal protein L19 [Patescibacteria group bacterium]MBU1685283.1 50S ribosomal protein L19 [Patescibacteria group bacterium]MBU1938480.1 50S ribosomal protein L19 [Patescibacteria group bacterium]
MHPTIEVIQRGNLKRIPEVKTGYTVEVSQKVTEGSKERIQKFQGLVIKVSHGAGVEKTFTVRKIVEGIGVEKVFPFHSPNITKIHVVKKAQVRRQKLYYMRERFGKSARLSEKHVTDEDRAAEEAKMEAFYAEAVKAEEKRLAEEAKKEQGVGEVSEPPAAETPEDETPEEEKTVAAPEEIVEKADKEEKAEEEKAEEEKKEE